MKFIRIALIIAASFLAIVIVGLWLLLFPPCTSVTLDSQWAAVISSGGCMMGHDDWNPAAGMEGWSVSPCWRSLIKHDHKELIPFLTAKLASRRPTAVHVDPWSAGLEGEIALYALQHATKKNWYSYSGTNLRIRKAINDKNARDIVNYQLIVQELLTQTEARNELARFFST
jgi:hypothetical protein